MVTTREAARDDRRAQILAQTAAIVGERGYHGFGLQELAQRCGVTKAGLLHHFPSKDQLLVAVLQARDREDEIVVAAQTGDGAADGSPHKVIGSFRAIVARNATRPQFVRLFAMLRAEALSADHPAHAWFAARERATLELFAQMVAPHVVAPHSTARHVMALMIGLELQWLRDDLAFDLVAEWDRGIATLLPTHAPVTA